MLQLVTLVYSRLAIAKGAVVALKELDVSPDDESAYNAYSNVPVTSDNEGDVASNNGDTPGFFGKLPVSHLRSVARGAIAPFGDDIASNGTDCSVAPTAREDTTSNSDRIPTALIAPLSQPALFARNGTAWRELPAPPPTNEGWTAERMAQIANSIN